MSGTTTLSLVLMAAAPPQAPTLANGGGVDISVWRVILALALCLALAGIAAWLLRDRLGGRLPELLRRREDSRLRLVERIALAPGASAALIAIDDHEVLVLSNSGAITVVPLEETRLDAGPS